MRTFKLPYGWSLLIWWWNKSDKRQKKPTQGFGIILERL